jgi:ribosomal protein L35
VKEIERNFNMKKSISNRIKITKTGKILRRVMGQGHCRAKKRSVQIRRKKSFREIKTNLI